MSNPKILLGESLRMLIKDMSPYKKVSPILAIQIDEDCELGEGFAGEITGSLRVIAGSWIAHDPVNNRTWPISNDIFQKVYRPITDHDSDPLEA